MTMTMTIMNMKRTMNMTILVLSATQRQGWRDQK
jgi:hypothetical protein